MKRRSVKFFSKGVRYVAMKLLRISDTLMYQESKLLIDSNPRSLYETPAGNKYWLNNTGYIDMEIINKGVFEQSSTSVINRLVKKGDVVLDVGANIGYYTVILSRLVGDEGKVIAFEPTKHFREVLKENISANELEGNIEIVDVGLSNKKGEVVIDIGPSSATLHSPKGYDLVLGHEKISLTTLDEFVKENGLERVDFVKIDVDGHEPFFFKGGWETLDKFSPTILFEISHLHYLEAGVTAWDFYDSVKSKGYNFFHEDDLSEIRSKEDFLRRCSNFDKSSNVVITKRENLNITNISEMP